MAALSEVEWIEAYHAHVGALFTYASKRAGGDRALAEDVTQEAWLRALDAWRGRGLPREPQAWLRATARNLLLNHFKRRRPEKLSAAELDLERTELTPSSPGAAAVLHWGLARLKAGQRRLIEAYHLDGKGIGALARELGLSERAVEGRLRRSRTALRASLAPYFRDGDTK